MRLLLMLALAALALPAGLYFVAGRPLGELFGFTRAAAQVTVDHAVGRVPTEIRDKKLDNDVEQQRRQLSEHQVALSLSRRELEKLQDQVEER